MPSAFDLAQDWVVDLGVYGKWRFKLNESPTADDVDIDTDARIATIRNSGGSLLDFAENFFIAVNTIVTEKRRSCRGLPVYPRPLPLEVRLPFSWSLSHPSLISASEHAPEGQSIVEMPMRDLPLVPANAD